MQVTDTLQEIQDRHDAVKQLEQSLMDVHQMFLDMAVLVESQGEMLNNIEAQVCACRRLQTAVQSGGAAQRCVRTAACRQRRQAVRRQRAIRCLARPCSVLPRDMWCSTRAQQGSNAPALLESSGRFLQVARSVEYVQGGTTALIQAKSYQKGTRKMICCALVIILIIVAVVVVVAIQPWKK